MTNHTIDQLLAILDAPTQEGTSAMRTETERRQAAMNLGMIKDPAVVPGILQRLRAETPGCGVHEDLTWATVQHIDQALPEVLAMLSDPNPHLRRTGAHILSKVGDPEHLDQLTPLVADADFDVALKAYRAVANSAGDQADKALDALTGRLGDGDALQRDSLTAALHRFGEQAVPALVKALADTDAEVREHAADALGHLGEDAAPAADALADLAADDVAAVRLSAVAALGQLGEAAVPGLQRLAGSDDATVAAVAKRFLG
ncbi:HEAT repeat domain-containing protein [Propioniciclava sinopodophylli]|uniref:HEAT repeat domain-containing protein n=1 Tax=Propioniciclava sinopodophylli TaxID=1837344 RepID=UPI002490737D|nr:HEAT repeat domain-containing protein [Propioniciclava sinopodophylli]